MRNLERRIIAGVLTLSITTAFLTGCDGVRADMPPVVTSGVLPDTTPRPSPTPEPSPSPTPTPEPTPMPTPTPEPSPTPEIIANPSKIISRGDKSSPEIAFTFDDSGPGLQKILEICREKGIKATFFLLAGELQNNPDLWRQAVADGFLVCNHSVGHRMDLPKISEEKMKSEILGWEAVATEVLGADYVARMKRDFPYFRAPGGNRSDSLQQLLGNLGYPTTAYWSCEDCWSMMPEHNPDNLTKVQYYNSVIGNGSIILAHGGTAGDISEIIDNAMNKGYIPVTLNEILD